MHVWATLYMSNGLYGGFSTSWFDIHDRAQETCNLYNIYYNEAATVVKIVLSEENHRKLAYARWQDRGAPMTNDTLSDWFAIENMLRQM